MNKKGFTLVELLATLVVLAIITGIVLVSMTSTMRSSKEKTEDVFVGTLKDALEIYIDSDAKNLSFGNVALCTVNKTHKSGIKIYKSTNALTFNDIINSSYHPLAESDMHNPANKNSEDPTHPYNCSLDATVQIYRDEDFVYYYMVYKADNTTKHINGLDCLNKITDEPYITNLPSGCY